MPSKKTKPIVVLDVANLKSVKEFSSKFPSIKLHLKKGKIRTARGGTLFEKELKHTSSFIPFFIELSKSGLVERVSNTNADSEVSRFKKLVKDEFKRNVSECDDPHLFSLLMLTNSKSLVSFDKRISLCKKCLRRSKIDNCEFANVKRISTDKNYLQSFNSNSL